MKLKAYSQNNAVKHLILHTINRFIWLPIVMTLLGVLVFILPEILGDDRMVASALKFNANTTFVFKTGESWELFPYFLIFISVISAYIMFAFLFNKKNSTMMMLTGVSRTWLFIIRYLYGLLSVLVPVMISFLILLNIGASNAEKSLMITENMCLMLAMVAFILIYSYTISVIAASLCGRKTEFFVVCAVFVFGVHAVLWYGGIILASFLMGFAYPLRDNSALPYTFANLFDKYSYVSINTVFENAFSEYRYSGYTTETPVRLATYSAELIWLAATIVILIPLAIYLFKNRRSEYDEKANANKTLSAVCTICISLFGSSFIMLIENSLMVFICSVAVFVILCALFHSFFEGTMKYLLTSLKYSLPAVAFISLFVLIAYTGMFGYANTVPAVNDIASVRMTYKGECDLFTGKNAAGFTNNLTATTIHFENFPEFTSEADIKTAIDIHKKLINDGSRRVSKKIESNYSDTVVYSDYYIVYTLKDGSELIRCYPQIKLSTLYETLKIEETDAYSELLSNRIKQHYDVLFDGTATFGLSDNMMSSVVFPNLADTDKQELINIIADEKTDDSFDEKYHPAKECVGVIWLAKTQEPDRTTPKSPIYVYDSDVKILEWLKEKGLADIFDAEYTVKDITVYELDYYASKNMKSESIDRYFKSQFNTDNYGNSPFDLSAKTVDEADFGSILEKCRLSYFTDGNNKYAVITVTNSDGEEIKTTKFITD